jgi:hypothetical protein
MFTLVEHGVIIPGSFSHTHSWTRLFFPKVGVIGAIKSVIRKFNFVLPICILVLGCFIVPMNYV